MNPNYIYLFIREDLSRPQQIIQTAHAAYEVATRHRSHAVPNAVLIGVPNLAELLDVTAFLKNYGIEHEMFFEPDINQHTAIATYPLQGEQRAPLLDLDIMK